MAACPTQREQRVKMPSGKNTLGKFIDTRPVLLKHDDRWSTVNDEVRQQPRILKVMLSH